MLLVLRRNWTWLRNGIELEKLVSPGWVYTLRAPDRRVILTCHTSCSQVLLPNSMWWAPCVPMERVYLIECSVLKTMNHANIFCFSFDNRKIVPYGLGNAPRTKRSLKDLFPTKATGRRDRCQCVSQKDKKCWNFCQAGKELRWIEIPLLSNSFMFSWPPSYYNAANKKHKLPVVK